MSRTPRVAAMLVCLALLLQGCGATPAKPEPQPPADVATQPEPEPEPQPPVAEPAPEPEPAQPPVAVVQEPEQEPAPPVVCEPPPAPEPAKPLPPQTSLAILGETELLSIDPPGIQLKARLDTGAAGSSLHALDVRQFERDGKTWVKFQVVDAKSGQSIEVSRPVVRTTTLKGETNGKRYVVSLKATIGSVEQFTEFTLSDRSALAFPAIIGRNFLRDQAVVDVGRRFTDPDSKP